MALIFIAIPIGALFGSTFYHLRQARGARLRRLGRGHSVPCRRDRNCRPLVARGPAHGSRRRSARHCCSPWPCSCVRTSPSARRSCSAAPASRRCGSVKHRRLAGTVSRLSAGVRHGAAQLVLRRRLCPVQPPHRHRRGHADAAAAPMSRRCGSLLRLDFAGGDLARGARQIGRMLIGPSESVAMIPVHAAALLIVFRVLLSRRYEGWLRLIAAATLGLYTPALFFHLFRPLPDHGLAAHAADLLRVDAGRRTALARSAVSAASSRASERQPAVVWLSRRLDGFARAAGIGPAISASVRNEPSSASSSAPRCSLLDERARLDERREFGRRFQRDGQARLRREVGDTFAGFDKKRMDVIAEAARAGRRRARRANGWRGSDSRFPPAVRASWRPPAPRRARPGRPAIPR